MLGARSIVCGIAAPLLGALLVVACGPGSRPYAYGGNPNSTQSSIATTTSGGQASLRDVSVK